MSIALRSVGLLDVLSSTTAGPSVARLLSTPVCASSLQNPVRNAGNSNYNHVLKNVFKGAATTVAYRGAFKPWFDRRISQRNGAQSCPADFSKKDCLDHFGAMEKRRTIRH